MRTLGRHLMLLVVMAIAGIWVTGAAQASIRSGHADAVWGQPDLTSNGCDPAHAMPTSLCHPADTAIDSRGNLWVADWSNSRVLMYPFDRTSGRPSHTPRKVLGQYDNLSTRGCNRPAPDARYPPAPSAYTLCMPKSLAFDSHGALYVADELNNRVLIYLHPDILNKHRALGADLVFGQKDFVSRTPNGVPAGGRAPSTCDSPAPASACSLFSPQGLSVDISNDLFVADTLNNRVLEWTAATVSAAHASDCTGNCYVPATRVWGQHGAFTTNCPNQTSNTSGPCTPFERAPLPDGSTLYAPQGVIADAHGNLFVADSANNRVLEYDHGVDTGAQDATLVYGQMNKFSSSTPDLGGVSAMSLSVPTNIALDPDGNVWVSDQGNNRLLEYPPPNSASVTTITAIAVVGQRGSFVSATPQGSNDGSLDRPDGLSFDRAGNAYVADHGDNDRVLEYFGLF